MGKLSSLFFIAKSSTKRVHYKKPPGRVGGGEVRVLNKISRIFTAGLLTIVLIRLSEFVPGFELASRADRLLFHMVMWLNLNELLKKSDD